MWRLTVRNAQETLGSWSLDEEELGGFRCLLDQEAERFPLLLAELPRTYAGEELRQLAEELKAASEFLADKTVPVLRLIFPDDEARMPLRYADRQPALTGSDGSQLFYHPESHRFGLLVPNKEYDKELAEWARKVAKGEIDPNQVPAPVKVFTHSLPCPCQLEAVAEKAPGLARFIRWLYGLEASDRVTLDVVAEPAAATYNDIVDAWHRAVSTSLSSPGTDLVCDL